MRHGLDESSSRFDVLGSGERSLPFRDYWHANLRLITLLLTIWFIVTFVVGYFAREMSFAFFGWPFSFWIGGQGALIVYVLLVGYYAWAMNRRDQAFNREEATLIPQSSSRAPKQAAEDLP
jgi:putative solute:sodium symporter small subunit